MSIEEFPVNIENGVKKTLNFKKIQSQKNMETLKESWYIQLEIERSKTH